MDDSNINLDQTDEDILTCNFSDEALEAAAGGEESKGSPTNGCKKTYVQEGC